MFTMHATPALCSSEDRMMTSLCLVLEVRQHWSWLVRRMVRGGQHQCRIGRGDFKLWLFVGEDILGW
jgi:hypothetical protein